MYTFETEVDITVIGNGTELPGSGKAKVKWVMTIEARENGVKCFGLYVPEQKINVNLECYNTETDEDIELEREFNLQNVKIEEMESAGNFQHLHLIPTELEIHSGSFSLRF